MTQIDPEQIALARRPLPAMRPVPLSDWLRVTPDYAAQLREKGRLLDEAPDRVLLRSEGSEAAEDEFGEALMEALSERADFDVSGESVTRPDGDRIVRGGLRPLELAARLIQEDICLLEKRGEEHVLKAGLLAFPSSWMLSEKLDRPLSAIHDPVRAYDAGIAARVQHMFDALAPGRVLSRANLLRYADPALFQPRSETARREKPEGPPPFWRSERQTLRKLPRTGAVVFTILTTVAPGNEDQPI